MAFQIINNTKVDENRIEWKFETLDKVFVSTADKFKRNIAFWQTKYNIGTDVKVEILNGVEHLYAQLDAEKNIIDVEHTEVTDIPTEATTDLTETLKSRIEDGEIITSEPAIESRVDEPTEQSDVFEDSESDVHTPKRKSRKKAS
jgi:hypothetical protein